jgi:DNA-binding HxlR family transcriptional regulator
MRNAHRSLCPINLSLEIFGDSWTLLILRDMIFGGRRHFRELLQNQEGIASNILADRLHRLVERGVLTRAGDPTHKQKAIYSLTESGIALVPVFAAIGAWGSTYLPVSEEFGTRARVLAKGGSRLWKALMNELRETHLGAVTPRQTAGSPRSGGKRARGARSAASARRSRTSPR